MASGAPSVHMGARAGGAKSRQAGRRLSGAQAGTSPSTGTHGGGDSEDGAGIETGKQAADAIREAHGLGSTRTGIEMVGGWIDVMGADGIETACTALRISRGRARGRNQG